MLPRQMFACTQKLHREIETSQVFVIIKNREGIIGGSEVGSCDWKDLNPNKDTETSMVYLYTVLTGTQAADPT